MLESRYASSATQTAVVQTACTQGVRLEMLDILPLAKLKLFQPRASVWRGRQLVKSAGSAAARLAGQARHTSPIAAAIIYHHISH